MIKVLSNQYISYGNNQNLQDTLSQLTTMNFASRQLSGTEDGSHIFEAIGLIIGLEDVPAEKQSDYLSLLLTPLCQQVFLVPTILLFALGFVYGQIYSDSLNVIVPD